MERLENGFPVVDPMELIRATVRTSATDADTLKQLAHEGLCASVEGTKPSFQLDQGYPQAAFVRDCDALFSAMGIKRVAGAAMDTMDGGRVHVYTTDGPSCRAPHLYAPDAGAQDAGAQDAGAQDSSACGSDSPSVAARDQAVEDSSARDEVDQSPAALRADCAEVSDESADGECHPDLSAAADADVEPEADTLMAPDAAGSQFSAADMKRGKRRGDKRARKGRSRKKGGAKRRPDKPRKGKGAETEAAETEAAENGRAQVDAANAKGANAKGANAKGANAKGANAKGANAKGATRKAPDAGTPVGMRESEDAMREFTARIAERTRTDRVRLMLGELAKNPRIDRGSPDMRGYYSSPVDGPDDCAKLRDDADLMLAYDCNLTVAARAHAYLDSRYATRGTNDSAQQAAVCDMLNRAYLLGVQAGMAAKPGDTVERPFGTRANAAPVVIQPLTDDDE